MKWKELKELFNVKIINNINDKLNNLADALTNSIMSLLYGERFDKLEDITEDDELSKIWEIINEQCFGQLWESYDQGYADAYEEMEGT